MTFLCKELLFKRKLFDFMIAELGHFALITAFILSLAQGVLPLFGAARGNSATMLIAPAAAISVALAVAFSFGALVWGFITSDFSLALVANHSIGFAVCSSVCQT